VIIQEGFMDYFILWVFPALLVGGLGAFLWLSVNAHIRRCLSVATWLKTSGVVESAEVITLRTRRFNRVSRSNYRLTRYEPKIVYAYSANGQAFKGSALQNFNGVFSENSRDQAAEVVALYPPGSKVEVTYNPEKPFQAYLHPVTNTERLVKQRIWDVLVLVIALVWFCIGTFLHFTGQVSAEKAKNDVIQGNALLPVSTDQMASSFSALVNQYGLNCTEDTMAGNLIVYKLKECSLQDSSGLTSVEQYVRRDDPQKVDLISAIRTPTNEKTSAVFLSDVTELVLTIEQAKSASEWIQSTLPDVVKSGASSSTTLDGITLTLDNLGTNVRLNIGKMQ